MADELTWGTDNPYVDQLPAAPESSWTDQLAGAAVGGMVRSRQAAEMAIGGVDWLADPILGKEISESDFNFLKGQRNIPFRAGMRVGEAQRLVSKFDYESVRERARAYGLDSWLGDITAGFVGSFLTDPTQVVGLGAGRALTVGVPALVGTRFATQATWLAGQNIAAGSARFGLTLMPELAFEKTLAGYTGQEYGVKDALMDAAGELALEGVMLGVDVAIGEGPDLFQKASRIVDQGYEQAKTRWEARKAKKVAPKATELPTVAETLAGDTQSAPASSEAPAEHAMAAADELPPVDAYDTAAENQSLYPADPQPGLFDTPLAEVAKELPKTTKSRKKVPHPEVPLEAVVLHTEALNRGENVSPADVAQQLELVEQAAESGQTPEAAPPRLDEGPEYVDPPAAEYSGEQAAPVEPQVDQPAEMGLDEFQREMLRVNDELDAFKRANPINIDKDEQYTPEQAAERARLVDKLNSILARRPKNVAAPQTITKATAKKSKRKVNAAVSAELIGLGSGLETNSGIAEAVQSLVESEKAYINAVSKNMPKEQADVEIEAMKETQKRMKEVAKAAAECVRGGK